MLRGVICSLAVWAMGAGMVVAQEQPKVEEGFTSMFNGKDLTGWKASEIKESFYVKDGAIVSHGKPRSHLFYVGDDKPFVNFELRMQVMTTPGSNAGVYFHTQYQETGWPKFGIEAQVNTTHKDPIKTGSLYQIQNVTEAPSKDDEWFDYTIRVEGKKVTVKVNDKVVVDYTEPAGKEAGKDFTRVLDKGTFCLQAHDEKSIIYFRNLRVKRLD